MGWFENIRKGIKKKQDAKARKKKKRDDFKASDEYKDLLSNRKIAKEAFRLSRKNYFEGKLEGKCRRRIDEIFEDRDYLFTSCTGKTIKLDHLKAALGARVQNGQRLNKKSLRKWVPQTANLLGRKNSACAIAAANRAYAASQSCLGLVKRKKKEKKA